MKKKLRKQIEQLEQKMSKSPNNMKDAGSHFLYRRERMIRFKMMQKISADIDNNQKTPPPEIYSLINILKNIPLVKQYTESLQPEQKPEKKSLTPDIVRQIEREILGME